MHSKTLSTFLSVSLCMCVYVHMHAYTYICIYLIYMCVYIYMYIYMYKSMDMSVYGLKESFLNDPPPSPDLPDLTAWPAACAVAGARGR